MLVRVLEIVIEHEVGAQAFHGSPSITGTITSTSTKSKLRQQECPGVSPKRGRGRTISRCSANATCRNHVQLRGQRCEYVSVDTAKSRCYHAASLGRGRRLGNPGGPWGGEQRLPVRRLGSAGFGTELPPVGGWLDAERTAQPTEDAGVRGACVSLEQDGHMDVCQTGG